MKILLTADNHLRDMQYGRMSRGEDFYKALLGVVDAAVQQKADVIVNAGDLFNSRRPSSANFAQLKELNKHLINNELFMLTISGNHDKTDPPWLEQVEASETGGIVCLDGLKTYTFETAGEKITFAPCGATSSDGLRHYLESAPAADVLLWHGAVREFCGFPTETAFPLEAFPTNTYRAIMLGDIHVTETKHLADGTPVSYPGSSELCSTSEDGDKYVLLYQFTDGDRFPVIEPVPLKTRPVVFITATSVDDMSDALRKAEEAAKSKTKPVLVFKYDKSIKDARKKLREVFGPDDGITRAYPVGSEAKRDASARKSKDILGEPEDLVGEFFPAGSAEFELGVQLVARGDVDPALHASRFLERAVEES